LFHRPLAGDCSLASLLGLLARSKCSMQDDPLTAGPPTGGKDPQPGERQDSQPGDGFAAATIFQGEPLDEDPLDKESPWVTHYKKQRGGRGSPRGLPHGSLSSRGAPGGTSASTHRPSRGGYNQGPPRGGRHPASSQPQPTGPQTRAEERKSRTVKIVFKRGTYTMAREIFFGLKEGGIELRNIENMAKLQYASEWSLTLKDRAEYLKVMGLGTVDTPGGVGRISGVGECLHNLRIHWVPGYVETEVVVEELRANLPPIARVVSVGADHYHGDGELAISHITTEVRQVVVSYPGPSDDLPHTMRIIEDRKPRQLLVTCANRPPLCLRCMNVGHVRRECRVCLTCGGDHPPSECRGRSWAAIAAGANKVDEEVSLGSDGEEPEGGNEVPLDGPPSTPGQPSSPSVVRTSGPTGLGTSQEGPPGGRDLPPASGAGTSRGGPPGGRDLPPASGAGTSRGDTSGVRTPSPDTGLGTPQKSSSCSGGEGDVETLSEPAAGATTLGPVLAAESMDEDTPQEKKRGLGGDEEKDWTENHEGWSDGLMGEEMAQKVSDSDQQPYGYQTQYLVPSRQEDYMALKTTSPKKKKKKV